MESQGLGFWLVVAKESEAPKNGYETRRIGPEKLGCFGGLLLLFYFLEIIIKE